MAWSEDSPLIHDMYNDNMYMMRPLEVYQDPNSPSWVMARLDTSLEDIPLPGTKKVFLSNQVEDKNITDHDR